MHNKQYMSTVLNTLKGYFTASQGDFSDSVHSDQMALGTVKREARPQKRQPKELKSKLTQGGA